MFEVAIPSYKRYDILKTQTLATLEQENIPKEWITIFVSNTDEEILYKTACPDYKIVVSAQTLNTKLNFIQDYYPDGCPILVCEDDIKKFKKITQIPFKDIVEQMFDMCRLELVFLWGIYPVSTSNNYYLKDRIVKGLKFCIGVCYGIINDKTKLLDDWVQKCPNEQGDKFRTLQYYSKHGAVLRYEGISPDTKWYGSGGLASTRTLETEALSAQYVVSTYPDLCSYRVKKNKRPDASIRHIIHKILKLEPC